ncbi:MAG: amino acid adenylation domain-containing protein [Verrucomicrobiae bacterium]|nr:amino acid adenylation domain-containing protein [Verrucomicrobiae bacterium]
MELQPDPNERPVDFDPFAGPEIDCTIPTTEAQREVLAASELGVEASCAYNESLTLELRGPLQRPALEQAVRLLVERHESLRATLSANDLQMIVARGRVVEPAFVDLSGLNEAGRERELAAIADSDMTTPFDLRTGPLLRVRLIRLAPDFHWLRLTAHHVVCDGWSFGILMAELSVLYTAIVDGGVPELPPAVPFSDYASAVMQFAASPEQEKVERFWLDRFEGPLPRMELPTDRPRPRHHSFRAHRLDIELPPELVKGLRETAVRAGASFVTILLTAYEVLLYKLTGSHDLVVGLPAAGQADLEMKHLVGHCVNLLALRSSVDPDRTFLQHLEERRRAVLDAYDHQRYTFGTLVRRLRVPREPGRVPLVPVLFNMDTNMDDGVRFGHLSHRLISNPRRFENFDLYLNATGNSSRLMLEWTYKTDLFDEDTIRSWMQELMRLIERIHRAPEATLEELVGDGTLSGAPQMPPASWFGEEPPYPRDVPLGDLFDEVVSQFGGRVAVELADERMDYRTLQERVRILSARLVALGVRPGDPVGLCQERSFGLIVSILAILRCGGCYVPFDPTYPQKRLQFMMEDSQVSVLLTQEHLRNRLPVTQARVVVPEVPEAAPVDPDPPMPVVRADAPAYIMYTSGSTGTPKGVVVPHRAIVRLVRSQNFLPFGPDLTFLQISNLSFDLSTLEIWGALLNGGRLVLQPQPKPTLQEIADTIQRHQVTTVWFTTGLFSLMVDRHLEDLRGLRHILAGGDVLSPPHVRKAFKVLGPGVLINGYGPTENTTFTTCHILNEEVPPGASVSIGRPIHNSLVYVLDSELRMVPIGRKGELCTGGDGVALGYWKREALTRERFVPDPFCGRPGAVMYRTGDLVRWQADGTLEFIGRVDRQIKERGIRVELGEIEAALDELGGLRERLVEVRQDAGERRLVGYLVPAASRDHEDPEARERLIATVRSHLRERLPSHMVPTAFVVIAALPLTPNGKVDRAALPAPGSHMGPGPARHEEPRDEVERGLATLWSRLLGRQRIGIHDDFFDLGGHSMTAIQLLSQVDQQFGRALPLATLFEAPTIARLAGVLRQNAPRPKWPNLSLLQPDGAGLPLFCVHGNEASYFIPRHLGPTRPFYAFMHQGQEGDEIRLRTVETIATSYVRQLKEACPNGPYLLCGYSFGGVAAFEMAHQLIAMGDSVPLLAMMDTYAPGLHQEAMKLEWRFYQPLWKPVKRWLVRWFLRRGRLVPPKLRTFYINDTYDQAVTAFRPRPYPGRITIFKAEHAWGPADLGWRDLAGGGLVLESVPGDHFSMIEDPQVEGLCRKLAQALADADNARYFDGA